MAAHGPNVVSNMNNHSADCPYCGVCVGVATGRSITFGLLGLGLAKGVEHQSGFTWLALVVAMSVVFCLQVFITKLELKERNSGAAGGF